MNRSMPVLTVALAVAVLLSGCGQDNRYAKTADGVVVTPDSGPA